MLRSIFLSGYFLLHRNEKGRRIAPPRSDRGSGGLSVLGATSGFWYGRHQAFDPAANGVNGFEKRLRPQLTAAGEMRGEIVIWGLLHNVYSG